MTPLVAVKELRYAGRPVREGEHFDASEKDAKLLVAIGKATYGEVANNTDLPKRVTSAQPDPQEPSVPLDRSQSYQTRHLEAGPTGEEASPPSSRRGRRPKAQESSGSEDEAGS